MWPPYTRTMCSDTHWKLLQSLFCGLCLECGPIRTYPFTVKLIRLARLSVSMIQQIQSGSNSGQRYSKPLTRGYNGGITGIQPRLTSELVQSEGATFVFGQARNCIPKETIRSECNSTKTQHLFLQRIMSRSTFL